MPNYTVIRMPAVLREVVRSSSSYFSQLVNQLGRDNLHFSALDKSNYVCTTLISPWRLNRIPVKQIESEEQKKRIQFNQIVQSKRLEVLEGSGRGGRGDGVFVLPINTEKDDRLPHSEILANFLLANDRPGILFATEDQPHFMPYNTPLDFAGVFRGDHNNVRDGFLHISNCILTRDPSGLIVVHDATMWQKIVRSIQEELLVDAETIDEFFKMLFPDASPDIPFLDKLRKIAVLTYDNGDVAVPAAMERATSILQVLDSACQIINALNESLNLPLITNPFASSDEPNLGPQIFTPSNR